MVNELPREAMEAAASAARLVHKRYRTYFGVEDVRQDLYLWLLNRPRKVAEWCDPDCDKEEHRVNMKKMQVSLNRQADKICRALKAQAIGYQVQDEQFYPEAMIEELIPYAVGELAEARVPLQNRVSGSSGDPSTRGNFVTSLIDIRRALESLNPVEHMMLLSRYSEDLKLSDIAEQTGLSVPTVSRNIKKSLRRMSVFLGGSDPKAAGYRVHDGEAEDA